MKRTYDIHVTYLKYYKAFNSKIMPMFLADILFKLEFHEALLYMYMKNCYSLKYLFKLTIPIFISYIYISVFKGRTLLRIFDPL